MSDNEISVMREEFERTFPVPYGVEYNIGARQYFREKYAKSEFFRHEELKVYRMRWHTWKTAMATLNGLNLI